MYADPPVIEHFRMETKQGGETLFFSTDDLLNFNEVLQKDLKQKLFIHCCEKITTAKREKLLDEKKQMNHEWEIGKYIISNVFFNRFSNEQGGDDDVTFTSQHSAPGS